MKKRSVVGIDPGFPQSKQSPRGGLALLHDFEDGTYNVRTWEMPTTVQEIEALLLDIVRENQISLIMIERPTMHSRNVKTISKQFQHFGELRALCVAHVPARIEEIMPSTWMRRLNIRNEEGTKDDSRRFALDVFGHCCEPDFARMPKKMHGQLEAACIAWAGLAYLERR